MWTEGRRERLNTDRRTDMTKLTVAFRNVANAPNNRCIIYTVQQDTQ